MHLEKVEYLGPKDQLNPNFLTLMGVLLHLPQVSRSFSHFCILLFLNSTQTECIKRDLWSCLTCCPR